MNQGDEKIAFIYLFHKSKVVFLIVLFHEAVEEKSKNSPFRKVKPIAGVQLFGPLASLCGPDRKRYMFSTISLIKVKHIYIYTHTHMNNNEYIYIYIYIKLLKA